MRLNSGKVKKSFCSPLLRSRSRYSHPRQIFRHDFQTLHFIIFFSLTETSLGLPQQPGALSIVARGKTGPQPATAGSNREKYENCMAYKWDVLHGANPGDRPKLKTINCCQNAGFTPAPGSGIRC
ncbi:hypothetical protein Cob_v007101 [Colletotrichum orbiculare MAFF 240422]|uniref:Uncharacterized protein n=1 Tax=Colletotrichum orbiculare (strain 104-T / ATCC 96160 / CBS 514.97 / LARS 414 / MAFF 240422) TaxID=1213857 RepID=A0A484FQ80_COLOR|nr:hypothetical protein Cob_v007101 [Colletotrichum orbiculare MAFF 240422]